jgi:hypothetical protein
VDRLGHEGLLPASAETARPGSRLE